MYPFFIPVPINVALRIEGNSMVRILLQLDVNSFEIQRVFLFNDETNEIYVEAEYATLSGEPRTENPSIFPPSVLPGFNPYRF